MALLAPHVSTDRLAHAATRQALVSTRAIARVSRFDGRTRIIAALTADGWQPINLPWTHDAVEQLRGDVREVLLSRYLRRARVPLVWVPKEERR